MQGGDLQEIRASHEDIGAVTLFTKSGEETTFDLGGERSEDNDDGVASSGEMIDTVTKKRWFVETTIAWNMVTGEELEKLNAMAKSPKETEYVFSHLNGTVYGAAGKVVGDIVGNTKGSVIPTKFSGGGKLEKIG